MMTAALPRESFLQPGYLYQTRSRGPVLYVEPLSRSDSQALFLYLIWNSKVLTCQVVVFFFFPLNSQQIIVTVKPMLIFLLLFKVQVILPKKGNWH